jgi:flagellar hook-length control protein FliK
MVPFLPNNPPILPAPRSGRLEATRPQLQPDPSRTGRSPFREALAEEAREIPAPKRARRPEIRESGDASGESRANRAEDARRSRASRNDDARNDATTDNAEETESNGLRECSDESLGTTPDESVSASSEDRDAATIDSSEDDAQRDDSGAEIAQDERSAESAVQLQVTVPTTTTSTIEFDFSFGASMNGAMAGANSDIAGTFEAAQLAAATIDGVANSSMNAGWNTVGFANDQTARGTLSASDLTAEYAADAANLRASASTAVGTQATVETAADLARRNGAGSLQASNASAQAPSANTRANDPFAKLTQSVQDSLQTAATANLQVQSAVAGRLAEVETNIARARAGQAISASGAQIDSVSSASNVALGELQGTSADTGNDVRAEASAGSVDGLNSRGNAANASLATSMGSFGAANVSDTPLDVAASSSQSIAGDLAATTVDDGSPAAQLAAKGAELLAKHRGGAITMRLEPPALGQLKIELRIAHGSVVADFTTATPEARMLLESNLGMLRERLESQGLSIDRLSVHGARSHADSSVASASNPQQNDARSQSDARSDGSGRNSDGGSSRQDAAGGESRGRREGDERSQDQNQRHRGSASEHDARDVRTMKRGFAGALADASMKDASTKDARNAGNSGTKSTRTAESVRRAG